VISELKARGVERFCDAPATQSELEPPGAGVKIRRVTGE
jgi:hypothetical protein